MDNRWALIRLKFEMNLDSLVNVILRSAERLKAPATAAYSVFGQDLIESPHDPSEITAPRLSCHTHAPQSKSGMVTGIDC